MSNSSLPCATGKPAILLVESKTASSDSVAQLGESHYCVTQTDSPRYISLMRHALRFTVAVLSDTLGVVDLRKTAETVRRQWPFTRIFILGKAPLQLEDHLYDEVVVRTSNPSVLLSTIDNLSQNTRKRTNSAFKTWLDSVSSVTRSLRVRVPSESDPMKLVTPITEAVYSRALPASLKGLQGSPEGNGSMAFSWLFPPCPQETGLLLCLKMHLATKQNLYLPQEIPKMPQSTHDRAAELHNFAAHAHSAPAASHNKGDHLTAQEEKLERHINHLDRECRHGVLPRNARHRERRSDGVDRIRVADRICGFERGPVE